jgi:hypothetical protein
MPRLASKSVVDGMQSSQRRNAIIAATECNHRSQILHRERGLATALRDARSCVRLWRMHSACAYVSRILVPEMSGLFELCILFS